jgi:hypothetical protein
MRHSIPTYSGHQSYVSCDVLKWQNLCFFVIAFRVEASDACFIPKTCSVRIQETSISRQKNRSMIEAALIAGENNEILVHDHPSETPGARNTPASESTVTTGTPTRASASLHVHRQANNSNINQALLHPQHVRIASPMINGLREILPLLISF